MSNQRIKSISIESAKGKSKEMLEGVKAKLGSVPNILGAMANSSASLSAYLNLSGAIGENSNFSDSDREQIALAISKINDCSYCKAAHSTIGKGAGLTDSEIVDAISGKSSSAKVQGAIDLSREIIEKKGFIDDSDFQKAKKSGLNDSDICELVAICTLNIYTNYFNHVVNTDIDFPDPPSA